MKLDLHTHMNGNGLENRLTNAMALARMAKALGHDGMMLGCHDWVCPESIAEMIRDRYELIVIKGAEVTTDAGHMLALNIPEITDPIHGNNKRPVSGERAIEEIHRLGGLAILSHPFPQGHPEYPFPNRLSDVRDMIDGIEVRNYKALLRHKIREFNWMEKEIGWIETVGSDCHPWEGDVMHKEYFTEIDLEEFGGFLY